MTRLALAAVLLAATATTASAGTYVGLGIGTAPATSTSTDQVTTESDGRSGRILLGYRLGPLALEGSAGRFGVVLNKGYDFDDYQLGGGLKLSHGLGSNFELYGRGGLQRTWLRSDGMLPGYNSDGSGYYLGGGFEYRINLLLTGASIFVDYQYSKSTVTSSVMTYDTTNRMWTMGMTFSL